MNAASFVCFMNRYYTSANATRQLQTLMNTAIQASRAIGPLVLLGRIRNRETGAGILSRNQMGPKTEYDPMHAHDCICMACLEVLHNRTVAKALDRDMSLCYDVSNGGDHEDTLHSGLDHRHGRQLDR